MPPEAWRAALRSTGEEHTPGEDSEGLCHRAGGTLQRILIRVLCWGLSKNMEAFKKTEAGAKSLEANLGGATWNTPLCTELPTVCPTILAEGRCYMNMLERHP